MPILASDKGRVASRLYCKGYDMRNPLSRRMLNRLPIRLWFDTPAEAVEWIGFLMLAASLALTGFFIICRP